MVPNSDKYGMTDIKSIVLVPYAFRLVTVWHQKFGKFQTVYNLTMSLIFNAIF